MTATTEKENIQIKSGGRRLPLYGEIGKYFSVDGEFSESAFRAVVHEALENIQSQGESDLFHERAREWLSSYLEEILGYLEEKGILNASFRLFQAAVDESAKMNVNTVTLPIAKLQRILSRASTSLEKKNQPDKKKKKIFDAALRLFGEHGFHEATMEKIAELAGVAKGTVYIFFKSKEDLIDQLLLEKIQEIVSTFSEIFSREDDILAQIQQTIEYYIDFIEKNHVLYRIIHSERIVRRTGNKALFYDYLISNLPMIKERIVSLNKKGEVKTTNFYTVWYGILGFIDGVVQKWFRCRMEYPLRDEVPVILEVLFNGFVGEQKSQKRFFIPPEERTEDSFAAKSKKPHPAKTS
jgi:Transcriptional regulator